jgi:hypothetical protein
VIVFGVTFISVLFATVTAFFISSEQAEETASAQQEHAETRELLRELASRLTTIETRFEKLQNQLR